MWLTVLGAACQWSHAADLSLGLHAVEAGSELCAQFKVLVLFVGLHLHGLITPQRPRLLTPSLIILELRISPYKFEGIQAFSLWSHIRPHQPHP